MNQNEHTTCIVHCSNSFVYIGQFVSEDEKYLVIIDRKYPTGRMKINKDAIVSILMKKDERGIHDITQTEADYLR